MTFVHFDEQQVVPAIRTYQTLHPLEASMSAADSEIMALLCSQAFVPLASQPLKLSEWI